MVENMEKLVKQIRTRLRTIDNERNRLDTLLNKLEDEMAKNPYRSRPTVRRSSVVRRPAIRRGGGSTRPKAKKKVKATARVKTTQRGSGRNGEVTRKDLIRQAKNIGIKGSDRMSREQIENAIRVGAAPSALSRPVVPSGSRRPRVR